MPTAPTPSNVLNVPYEQATLLSLTQLDGKQFVHVDHSTISVDQNLIEISRKDTISKANLVALANRGFTLYRMKDGVSSFVRRDRLSKLWSLSREGTLKEHEQILYQVQLPESGVVRRLLVVFSSIAGKMYQASLMRHFEQNYKSALKHAVEDTAILRVPDLGGVCGSFYMNTVFAPDNEIRIASMLRHVVAMLGISGEDVVLFGTSKGGTASLYYGVKLGWKFVAVDPIVSDEVYLKRYNDAHFVTGVFPKSKQDSFSELLTHSRSSPLQRPGNAIVIYSDRSPQFDYINTIVANADGGQISFVNCSDPRIKNHPDVAPVTRDVWQVMVNMALLGLPYKERRADVRIPPQKSTEGLT